MIVEHDGLLE